MAEKFSASDWNRYARWYDRLNSLRPYAGMLTDVIRMLPADGFPVLDAGCGTGNLIRQLLPRTVIGVDSCDGMLRRAIGKCPGAMFRRSDLDEKLPFIDGQFGSVVCVNALYALKKPRFALAEFFRILQRGGRLVLATPKRGYENGLILKAHCKSREPDRYWQGMHRSPEREARLVRRALPERALANAFLHIVRFNRRIAANSAFHFFDEAELRQTVESAGFNIERYSETYARQSHLLVARKP